jgi:hypothetical protein
MKTSNVYRFFSLLILLSTNILISFADASKYGRPSDLNGDSGGGLGGIFFLLIIFIIGLIGSWIGKIKNNK